MRILVKHSETKKDTSNIITLGILARNAKKNDPKVINATIGMLYDEQSNLFTFKSVDKVMNELSSEEKFAYPSTPGSQEFHEALKRWVFRQYYEEILGCMHCECIATPGGSGAISNTFSNYLNQGDKVLLPNYMWGNYKQFAYENYASYETYNMFDGNHFDLPGLEKQIYDLKEKQGRILLVLNDPCHNPTGYTMKHEEWLRLIDIINEATNDGTPFVLLYDMAYIDYDLRGFDATRNNIRLFENLNPSAMVILAFSGSKTLALYGLRVGAQIALCKDKEAIEDFHQANKFSSRAKWSTTSQLGMSIITKIFLDEDLKQSFEEELETSRKLLISRANAFIDGCKEVDLKTLPFECGFFITIPCENPDLAYEKLVKKGVHIIPMGNVLRVTLSAITLEECKKLPKIIKECI